MTGRLQSVPLEAIQTEPRLQNRNVGMQKYKEHSDAKRYKDHINQLTRSIKAEGQQIPMKVIAAEEGGSYELAPGADRPHYVPTRFWLVDGHHRLEALKKTGAAEALVEVLPGLGLADARSSGRKGSRPGRSTLTPHETSSNSSSRPTGSGRPPGAATASLPGISSGRSGRSRVSAPARQP